MADAALAGTGLAASPGGGVEGEAGCSKAPRSGLGGGGEEAPQLVPQPEKGGRHASRRPPNGGLVHGQHPAERAQAGEGGEGARVPRLTRPSAARTAGKRT